MVLTLATNLTNRHESERFSFVSIRQIRARLLRQGAHMRDGHLTARSCKESAIRLALSAHTKRTFHHPSFQPVKTWVTGWMSIRLIVSAFLRVY